jgi:hypothetical protein
MSLRVYYEVLNQKGSPALYTDTFANRPAFGFQGRLFISTDTGQIFEDTGSAWTLVADAGVGGGTLSSVTANGNTTAFGINVTAGGLTSNSLTTDIATLNQVKAVGSGGLSFNSNNGTQIAAMGGGGGANITFYGGLTGTNATYSNQVVSNNSVGFLISPTTNTTASQFKAENASGVITIGIDSSTAQTYFNGNYSRYIYSTGNYPLDFYTTALIRMRLSNSGNLLINKLTDNGYPLQINGTMSMTSTFELTKLNTGVFFPFYLNGTVYYFQVYA